MIAAPLQNVELTNIPQGQTLIRSWAAEERPEAADNYKSVEGAWMAVDGPSQVCELLPLAAVDPESGSVLVPHEQVKEFLVRQTHPKMRVYGNVKRPSDIITHAAVIEMVKANMKFADGRPMPVDAIVLSPTGDKLIVQFPLEMMDVHGDPVKQYLILWSSVVRSAGAGIALWHLPIRCTNQLPLLQMSGGKHGYTIDGKRATMKIEDLIANAAAFAESAPERLRRAYSAMIKAKLTETQIESLTSELYPTPEMSAPKLTDNGFDYEKRLEAWRKSMETAKANRAAVVSLMQNGNGTHDTPVTREPNLYSYLQAVSELHSKMDVKSVGRAAMAFLGGGTRQKPVNMAFGQCLRMLKRHGFSLN